MADKYLGSDNSNWSAATWWDVDYNPTTAPADGDKVFLNSKVVNLDVSTPSLAGLYGGRAEDFSGSGYIWVVANNLTISATTIKPGTVAMINMQATSWTLTVICTSLYGCDNGGGGGGIQISALAGPCTLNFTGNVYARAYGCGILTDSAYDHTVNITGNIYGSTTASSTQGLKGRGTANIVGTVYGGSQLSAHGVQWRGILSVTNVVGGSNSLACGILPNGAYSMTITVTGTVCGGSSTGHGIYAGSGTHTITVNGSVTGGSESGAHGIYIASGSSATINANATVYGGAAGCGIRYEANTGTINVTAAAAVVGGLGTNARAIWFSSSSGTLNVIGTVRGGTASSTEGIVNASTGTVNITGDIYCQSGGGSGVYNGSSGPVNITGSVYGCIGGTSIAVYNNSTGKITIIGSIFGGDSSDAYGLKNQSTGSILISANVTGGTNSTAYGVYNNSTGWVFYGGTKTNNAASAFNSENYVRNGVIAKTAGSWNTGSNWHGGLVPTAGQNIILNGLSMTFDIDSATVGDVYGQGGAGQIAFDVSGGNKSFTAANIYAGTNTGGCIKVTGSGGNTFTLSCQNLYGGSSSGAMGMDIGSAGTFNVIMSGNVYGGSTGLSTAGIRIAANAIVTLTGNVYATSTSYGINVLQSNITVNITGHIYGGESSSNYVFGFYVSSSYSNVTLNVTGNLYGGGGAGMYNVAVRYEGQSDTSAITVNGSCYGSATASNAGGAAIRADGRQQIIVTGSCYGRRYSDSIGNYAIYLPYYATSAQTLRVDGDLVVETDAHTCAVALGAGVSFTLGGDIYCSSKGIAVGGFKSFNWTKANGKIVIVSNGTPLTFASSPFRRLNRFI